MTEHGDLLISSPANPRLKAVLALRNRRDRDATGTTRLEGREELELALRAGVAPHTLFFCPELLSRDGSGTEVVAAVRKALGPDIVLMIDVQYLWDDAATCLSVVKDWGEFDIYFLETPIWADNLEEHRKLAEAAPIVSSRRRSSFIGLSPRRRG